MSLNELHTKANEFIKVVNTKLDDLLKVKYGNSFIQLNQFEVYVTEKDGVKFHHVPQTKIAGIKLTKEDVVNQKGIDYTAAEIYDSIVSIVDELKQTGEGKLVLVKFGTINQVCDYDSETDMVRMKIPMTFSATLI